MKYSVVLLIMYLLLCGCKKEENKRVPEEPCGAGEYNYIEQDEQGRIVSYRMYNPLVIGSSYATHYSYIGDSLIVTGEQIYLYTAKLNNRGFIEKEYYGNNTNDWRIIIITTFIYDATNHLIREESAHYDSTGALSYTFFKDYEWENENLKRYFPYSSDSNSNHTYTEYKYATDFSDPLKTLKEKVRMKGVESVNFMIEKSDHEFGQVMQQLSYVYYEKDGRAYYDEKAGETVIASYYATWPCK